MQYIRRWPSVSIVPDFAIERQLSRIGSCGLWWDYQ